MKKLLDKIAMGMIKLPLYLLCLIGNIMDLHRRTKKDVRKEYEKHWSKLYYPIEHKC